MPKEKQPASNTNILVSIFRSKRTRNIIAVTYLFFAILIMICIDSENEFRTEHLPFLDHTWVVGVFEWLGIQRYNVTASSWLIFVGALTVFTVLIIADIAAPHFVEKRVEKNRNMFSSERKARIFYNVLWWGTLLLIAAFIILIMYFLGTFKLFHANTAEKSPFASLGYALLILTVLLIPLPLILLLIYLAVRTMIREVKATRARDKKVEAVGAISVKKSAEPDQPEQTSEYVFPSLMAIDDENAAEKEPIPETEITLEDFVKRFQAFAANKHRIYYELPMLRRFIAGLASSRLIILEGISGTGKSMLPRMFKEFTGSDSFFMPIQATWRDKSDVLGFYSEFTKTFKPTAFLESMYAASYSDRMNVMVLDEMNLSRVEYYFADFLSVLEYPEEDWKIKIYSPGKDQVMPKKLDNGFVSIPANTWFVGTANTDDSTFTITDKVCDRAIILNFEDRFARVESDLNSEPITISANALVALFNAAMNDPDKCLNESDLNKFEGLCEYVKEHFDVLFGNRIMVQIEKFVPVFVALGGTKEEALDFMFAKKILRKMDRTYQEYQQEKLLALNNYIAKEYGKDVFKETERVINKMAKRFM